LPKTDSIRRLAEFWDSHDITDFEEELEEVDEPVFERDTSVEVRLAPADADSVHRLAQTKGVSDAALIREWVREKLSRRNGRAHRLNK
jgi:hypothetical protein